MLTCVDFVLRQYPALENVEHETRSISRSISRFLRPPPSLLLSEACRLGTTAVLDWIWSASCTRVEDRTAGWSLTNYLRSDPFYHQWQFIKSLYIAAERGDLAVVEWLFDHFSGCEGPVEIVKIAEKGGHLRVLRCLWENRSDNTNENETERTTTPRDGDSFVKSTVQFEQIHDGKKWGHTVISKAVENGQLAQCLGEGMGLDFHDRVIAIKSALRLGDIEFAEQILPPDTSILQYATECRQPDIIARVLDGGYLNWDEQLAATTLVHLAERGSAQIMQQIMQLHSPLREKHWDWEDAWIEGLKAACSNDNLSVLVWLMEHPLGRQVRHNFEHDFHYSFLLIELLQSVAERGHVAVMQYLNELGLIGGEIERPTLASIWTFHLDSVKWLVDQDLIGDQCAITCVIHNAAFHGRLDILKLFHVLDSPRDYEAVGLKRRRTVGAFSIQGREHIAFYMAAERGHVDILEWLTVNYPATGALQDKPMFNATRDGHLGALKWLHENRADLNTVFGMQQASENGHFEVVKWLYVNRLDSRSRLAITVAIQCGHFRIAYWLAEKFPDVADFIEIEDNWPIRDDWLASNFEALLFLRVMYLDMFTARSLRVLRSKCTCVQLPFVSKILLGWLQDNYPQEE